MQKYEVVMKLDRVDRPEEAVDADEHGTICEKRNYVSIIINCAYAWQLSKYTADLESHSVIDKFTEEFVNTYSHEFLHYLIYNELTSMNEEVLVSKEEQVVDMLLEDERKWI